MGMNVGQQMRFGGWPRTEISLDLAVGYGKEVSGVGVVELIDLPAVRAAQWLPTEFLHKDPVAESESLFEKGIFSRQDAGYHLDHLAPRS
jgi:hypothetical protein